jgi:hypothetical protein
MAVGNWLLAVSQMPKAKSKKEFEVWTTIEK